MILTKPQRESEQQTTQSREWRGTVLLIDVSNVAHVAWHGFRGNVDLPRFVADKVRRLAELWQCCRVICAEDSRQSFRRDLDQAYKAHRPETDQDLVAAVESTRQELSRHWTVIGALGYEADDAIATACRCAREVGLRAIILSADKDLRQCLVDGSVTICRNARSNGHAGFACEWLTASMLRHEYGVTPAQWPDWQALVGDKSDGIVGANGIGPKTATELLQAAGDLSTLLEAPERFSTRRTVQAALITFRSRAELVRQLVTLKTDCPLVQEVFA